MNEILNLAGEPTDTLAIVTWGNTQIAEFSTLINGGIALAITVIVAVYALKKQTITAVLAGLIIGGLTYWGATAGVKFISDKVDTQVNAQVQHMDTDPAEDLLV